MILRWTALIFLALCSGTSLADIKPKLVVYTYDSFISKWGPGPSIKKSFELSCACEVQWVPAADGAASLARLRIEGSRSQADVLLGLDDTLTYTAEKMGLFSDGGITLSHSNLPADFKASTTFIPFDFGYYAFMFDTKAKSSNGHLVSKPASLAELLESKELDRSVLIQDPRSSATGLGLLLWLQSIYGKDTAKQLVKLKNKTLTVSRGWSDSYSLFTKGEAPLVFSYTTSEAFHRDHDKDSRYEALIFPEGHYAAIETVAILKSSRQKELAKAFIKFLISDSSQATIASMNWMYPANFISKGLPPSYASLRRPKKLLRIPPKDVDANRSIWTKEWDQSFRP